MQFDDRIPLRQKARVNHGEEYGDARKLKGEQPLVFFAFGFGFSHARYLAKDQFSPKVFVVRD